MHNSIDHGRRGFYADYDGLLAQHGTGLRPTACILLALVTL